MLRSGTSPVGHNHGVWAKRAEGAVYEPKARERVEVDGRPGVFFVLAIDLMGRTADLAEFVDEAYLLEDVPFSQLRLHQSERGAD